MATVKRMGDTKVLFESNKERFVLDYLSEHPENEAFLVEELQQIKPIQEKDTTIRYFVYSKELEYKYYSADYFPCLNFSIDAKMADKSYQEESEKIINSLSKKYGDEVQSWFDKIEIDKFQSIEYVPNECYELLGPSKSVRVKSDAFTEFEQFLRQVKDDRSLLAQDSKDAEKRYVRAYSNASNGLPSNISTKLARTLDKANLVKNVSQSRVFEGELLGSIPYEISGIIFDRDSFDKIVNEIALEYYSTNRLRTGEMPYAYCFGRNNNCYGYQCSEMVVHAPKDADVIVSIKKSGDVYRHAYIRANESFRFQFPNGTYQTYFYYGNGWNPNKHIKETECGRLNGGFVSNEVVGKDTPQALYDKILTYELYAQFNGNFQTKSSNKLEAF